MPHKRQSLVTVRKRKKKGTKKRRLKASKRYKDRIIRTAPVVESIAHPSETESNNNDSNIGGEDDTGYAKGYRDGLYAGGDEIVDQLLPPHQLLPDISVRQIIAAGISMYLEHAVSLLQVEQVGDAIIQALDQKRPLSIVRLGDGELLTLAQEIVMPVETVRREGKFLEYAGVKIPDLDIRNKLAEAVTRADMVGIPRTRMPNYQLLVSPVFQAYGISFAERQWTDSLINYSLYQAGYLPRILRNRRVLLVGNMAEPLSAVLAQHGIHITGIVTPVNGASDAARVVQLARQYEFDIALISAGIAAVLITEELVRLTGKVAIDFGHLANAIVKGESSIQP